MPERQVCTEICISTKFRIQHRNDLDYTYQHGCNRTSIRTQNYQESTVSFHVLYFYIHATIYLPTILFTLFFWRQ